MRLVLIYFFAFLFINEIKAQPRDLLENGPIHLTLGDSVITFTTTNEEPKIDGLLQYHCFKNFELHKIQGGYIGNVLNGPYTLNVKNKLIEKGDFEAGLKNGVWKKWNKNGSLMEIHSWKGGMLEGDFLKLDVNGQHIISGEYRKNVYDGEVRMGKNRDIVRYFSNGKEVSKDEFTKKSGPTLFKGKSKKDKGEKPKKDHSKNENESSKKDRPKKTKKDQPKKKKEKSDGSVNDSN